MKRRFRLRDGDRFRELRTRARAYSDTLIVLCALPNDQPHARFGFAVSSRIGGAVERNRIRRQLREIMRLRMADVQPGWDILVIARKPIRTATYRSMDSACARLLGRAHLLDAASTGMNKSREQRRTKGDGLSIEANNQESDEIEAS